jgi:hypothetical protein
VNDLPYTAILLYDFILTPEAGLHSRVLCVDLNGSSWGDLAGNFASLRQRLESDDIGKIDA